MSFSLDCLDASQACAESRAAATPEFKFLYPLELPLLAKIERVATSIYGAAGIEVSDAAKVKLAEYERLGFGHLVRARAFGADLFFAAR